MRCPYCGSADSKVVDSRDVEGSIRRRRECLNAGCAGRFTTYERIQEVALYIVKKDGRREEFSREKLLSGLRKACEKRPLQAGAIEAVAQDIENQLYQANAPEISSETVGELVMARLRDLDPVDAREAPASSFTGYVQTFLRAGFKTVACHVPRRPIMRHDLKGIGRRTVS